MKLFQKGELKLLWPFYLDALISPMLYFMPAFFVIYFLNLGFSLFQIGILTSVIPLFMLLFEIPTGAVADLYGRKFSVLLSVILEGVGIFLVFFLDNFYAILFALALAGFGTTFNSGAREAWITDLIKQKRKDFLHGYFTKGNSIDSLGLVVSGLIGVLLVKQFGLSIIWIAAGFSYLLSFFILAFGDEHFTKKKVKISESFKKVNKQAIKSINYSRKHHVLFYFLIASLTLVIAGNFSSGISWTPLLQNLGFPEYAFGYMWSAMGLVGVIAPLASSVLLKKGKEKKFIAWSLVLGIITISAILLTRSLVIAFSILMISLFFTFLSRPAERVLFHRFIPSKLRATIGSVESMVIAVAAIVSMPLVGLSVDLIGAKYTIFLSAILMIPAAIIFYKIKD